MGPRVTRILLILASLGCAASARAVDFGKDVAPLLARYCTGCHGGKQPKSDFALDLYKDDAAARQAPKVWDKVAQALRAREMPPKGKPKPTAAELDQITGWIETALAHAGGKRDPGRVTLHRLNRPEYNNTIRDLVGVHFQPADDFPSDDVGYGFDNIGDVLSLPPILLEKYLRAADKIVTAAFASPELRKRIMIHEPKGPEEVDDCARKILDHFVTRAYRRPVRSQELDRLVRLVQLVQKNGDPFDKGIQLALQAVLVSPNFLFRVEQDPAPQSPDNVRTLNEFELATRLSYFLWSTMPDEELFDLARRGELRKGNNLELQVRRMLKDPKAHALVENFAGQWLQLRNLKQAQPDPGLFPPPDRVFARELAADLGNLEIDPESLHTGGREPVHLSAFNEQLRADMVRETELFFESIVKEDRSILDFLDANYTFLNERLARHYGIEGVKGNDFRRVSLAGTGRGGLLTQGSILTVTSNPTRTSPVKRGKWVLENLLGTPPPPPPPDVPPLSEERKIAESDSLRKRLEQHRANPVCASCHERMDPLGFGLENFDAVGAWRTRDGRFPIDASGTLPDGQTFSGPRELRVVLRSRAREFRRCLTEKMVTYALGRGLEYYDSPTVEEIAQDLAQNGDRFSRLVLAIVRSDPFQKRRGKGEAK